MMGEDYVSFETAKLLKEKGFTEWCFKCYGVAVLHNGADISFDEECDLRDYGREDEIEYVEGGRLYDYGCNNRDKDAKVWAAPTLWVAMKWLRDTHKIFIEIKASIDLIGNPHYAYFVLGFDGDYRREGYTSFEWTYEKCCDEAVKYCLETL